MKKLIIFFTIFSLHGIKQPSLLLQTACDKQYIEDMESILRQFAGIENRVTLKFYQDYMLLLKSFTDLGYTLTTMEWHMNSELRTRLRTPLQNFSLCRTKFRSAAGRGVGSLSLPKAILDPCDRTYAVDIQRTLDFYQPKTQPALLYEYQNFMVLLKQYEDYRFKIQDFERLHSTKVITKLRKPLARYSRCRQQ